MINEVLLLLSYEVLDCKDISYINLCITLLMEHIIAHLFIFYNGKDHCPLTTFQRWILQRNYYDSEMRIKIMCEEVGPNPRYA